MISLSLSSVWIANSSRSFICVTLPAYRAVNHTLTYNTAFRTGGLRVFLRYFLMHFTSIILFSVISLICLLRNLLKPNATCNVVLSLYVYGCSATVTCLHFVYRYTHKLGLFASRRRTPVHLYCCQVILLGRESRRIIISIKQACIIRLWHYMAV